MLAEGGFFLNGKDELMVVGGISSSILFFFYSFIHSLLKTFIGHLLYFVLRHWWLR